MATIQYQSRGIGCVDACEHHSKYILAFAKIEVGYPRGKGREKKIPISSVPENVWLKSVVKTVAHEIVSSFFCTLWQRFLVPS